MNWYKIASEVTEKTYWSPYNKIQILIGHAVAVTPKQFGAMTPEEKQALARCTNLSPQTQRLFFTERYEFTDWVVQDLARNKKITQETQSSFFTGKFTPHGLAFNTSITLETQRLFFTEDYEWKNQAIKNLAFNEGIAPATQLLFFTEQYKDKDKALWNLAENHSFLRGEFTPGQWLQIKKAARGSMRLLVLSKRLKQIAGVS